MALVLCHVAFIAGLVLTYHRLPERLASHFSPAGQPNDWMSRTSHVWTMGGLAIGLSALILGLFYCVRFFPDSMISLPRRDYWLAPERREETFSFVFRAGIWLASFEALFLLGIHLLLVAANASSPPQLSPGVWVLGVLFLATVVGWVFVLFQRFHRMA